MPDLLVITPTRGRPESVKRVLDAWGKTCTGWARLVFCTDVDDDDHGVPDELPAFASHFVGRRKRLAAWTNWMARAAASHPEPPAYLASFGDDHYPRTVGWDETICRALRELGTGFVYPDDGHEHENLPTAVALTSDIVRKLGWMCFPGTQHLYVDMAWRDIGLGIKRYKYLPDVLVEHLSTYTGKAPEDDTSRDHWSDEAQEADRTAWNIYHNTQMRADIAKLKELL